jgi:uncharacterized HAD superfamily protein
MSISRISMVKNFIGIDIDNVLSDSDYVIRKLIEQEFGIKSKRKQITRWNYHESLPITLDQEKKVFELFHNRYCLLAPTIPYAAKSLRIISETYSIWLITCRPIETISLTKQWLSKHKIVYDNLVYSCNKSDYFEKFEFMIEDNGEIAIAFADNGVPVILFNNPWNIAFQ